MRTHFFFLGTYMLRCRLKNFGEESPKRGRLCFQTKNTVKRLKNSGERRLRNTGKNRYYNISTPKLKI